MISSRDLIRLQQIKEGLGSKYGTDLIDCCATDVTNEESVQDLQRATHRRFGTVNAVVNHAGIIVKGYIHECNPDFPGSLSQKRRIASAICLASARFLSSNKNLRAI